MADINQKILLKTISDFFGANGVDFRGVNYSVNQLAFEENSQIDKIGEFNIYPKTINLTKSSRGILEYNINLEVQLLIDENYMDLTNVAIADEADLFWLLNQALAIPGVSAIFLDNVRYDDTMGDRESARFAFLEIGIACFRNYR